MEKALQNFWNSLEVVQKVKKQSEMNLSDSKPASQESSIAMKFKTLEARASLEYHGDIDASVTLNGPSQELDVEFKKKINSEVTLVYNHISTLESNTGNLGVRWSF